MSEDEEHAPGMLDAPEDMMPAGMPPQLFFEIMKAPHKALRCPSCMHASMMHSPAGCIAPAGAVTPEAVSGERGPREGHSFYLGRCLCAWPLMSRGQGG